MAKTHTSTLKNERPIGEIWAQFKELESEDDRNTLILEYLHLVKYIATRIYAKLPKEVEFDDLIQAGIFGLKNAIHSFDMTRMIAFEAYAPTRIRGAILDELRAMDWVPRLVRTRTASFEAARDRFVRTNGREPDRSELAKEMNIGMRELEKIEKDTASVSKVSISRAWFSRGDGAYGTDVEGSARIQDSKAENPVTEAKKKEVIERLTRGLSRQEIMIVRLYYYEEMTMKEIGVALDLCESRVSQMHTSIIRRFRSAINITPDTLQVG